MMYVWKTMIVSDGMKVTYYVGKESDRKLHHKTNYLNGKIFSLGLSDMMTVVWKEKHEVHMPTDTHNPPAQGTFCNRHGNALMQRCTFVMLHLSFEPPPTPADM
jgi:hypothetical protein